MNAKRTDLGRVQEIHNIIKQTQRQIASTGLTQESFINTPDDTYDLVAEGVMNRVFRVAEEAGRISDEVADAYDFDSVGARGVRNRLAHAYGDVDREIIWQVIDSDFDVLLAACQKYCEDVGVDLE